MPWWWFFADHTSLTGPHLCKLWSTSWLFLFTEQHHLELASIQNKKWWGWVSAVSICVFLFCLVLCAYLSLKCHLSQAQIFFSLWIFLGKVINFKRMETRLNVCSQNSFVRSMHSQSLALGIFSVPLQYIHYDGGRLSAGLSDPPESDSRDLACWHTGGAEALPP